MAGQKTEPWGGSVGESWDTTYTTGGFKLSTEITRETLLPLGGDLEPLENVASGGPVVHSVLMIHDPD